MFVKPKAQRSIRFTPIYLWAVVHLACDFVDGVASRAVAVVKSCACAAVIGSALGFDERSRVGQQVFESSLFSITASASGGARV